MSRGLPPHDDGNRSPVDEEILEVGLRMTPAERLRWLEETVQELLPWIGLAASEARARDEPPGRPKAPGASSS